MRAPSAGRPQQDAGLYRKLKAYCLNASALGTSPRPEVVSVLKAGCDTLCFRDSQRLTGADWLALCELLLDDDMSGRSDGFMHSSSGDGELVSAAPVAALNLLPQPSCAQPCVPLRRLLLPYQGIAGLNGGLLIGAVIRGWGTLIELDLDGNRIDSRGGAAIADGLRVNSTLQVLSLHGNPLGPEGTCAIAQSLMSNKDKTAISHLNVENTYAGVEGVRAVETAAEMVNEERHALKQSPMELYTGQNFHTVEIANAITHGIPAIGAIIGTISMLGKTWASSDRQFFGSMIFGFSMITCFLSSTLYHSFFSYKRTFLFFRILDHCAIYLLIAASFTPLLLVNFREWYWSLWLLILQWGGFCFGVVYNCFHAINTVDAPIDKFELSLYVCMGWSAILILPLAFQESSGFQFWLFLGGASYTCGLPFFINEYRWPMGHAVWHLFVAGGAFCHFMMISKYTCEVQLPAEEHGIRHTQLTELLVALIKGRGGPDFTALLDFWNRTGGIPTMTEKI